MRCAGCEEPLPPKRGRGKPRKFCVTCRPPRTAAKTSTPEPAPLPRTVVQAAEGSLVESVEAELVAAGKHDASIGQQALSLARRIMSEQDSGAAIASMHKELRVMMNAATAGSAADAGDFLDELSARRERRRA